MPVSQLIKHVEIHHMEVMLRHKIAIAHPYLDSGGSEAAVMWMIEALKDTCDVTVITTGGWDRERLNKFYGTDVKEDEVQIRVAPVPWFARKRSVAALRAACLQRFARQVAGEYDHRISAYNPMDWGIPAVHLIADFSWHQGIRNLFDPPTPGVIYRNSLARRAYLLFCGAFAWYSGRDIVRDDLLLANSQWSADLLHKECGVDRVPLLYPPVLTKFQYVDWEDKLESFVIIGRIAPEKRIEEAIAILKEVRDHGFDVRLQICGQIGDDLYGKKIEKISRANADWIILEGRVSGEDKARVLTSCKYGIQTRRAEPFGISVAEMVKAGALVFAPAEGGQKEIIDNPSLLFNGHEEAVQKIVQVLNNPQMQRTLREHLENRSKQFGEQVFMKQIQSLVASRFEINSRDC